MKSVLHPVMSAMMAASALVAMNADADVQEFINDREGWEASVGNYESITFTEYSVNTIITNQYRDSHGIAFDGFSHIFQTVSFPNDGHGLRSPKGVRLLFDSPQQWVAVDFPGAIGFELFANGESIYWGGAGPSGSGNFFGVVSSMPFDEVMVFQVGAGTTTFIDDVHFGPPIPAPGVLGVFALTAVAGRSWRRLG